MIAAAVLGFVFGAIFWYYCPLTERERDRVHAWGSPVEREREPKGWEVEAGVAAGRRLIGFTTEHYFPGWSVWIFVAYVILRYWPKGRVYIAYSESNKGYDFGRMEGKPWAGVAFWHPAHQARQLIEETEAVRVI